MSGIPSTRLLRQHEEMVPKREYNYVVNRVASFFVPRTTRMCVGCTSSATDVRPSGVEIRNARL